jgi:anti-sigma factor RsiW
MMDCKQAELLVSKALDGEASPEEARYLDEHCTGCAACRAFRSTQASLHDELKTGLGSFLDAARPVPRRSSIWPRLARVAAVLALMFASGMFGYSLARPQGAADDGGTITTPADADASEPRVTVAKAESEGAEQLIWDEKNGLRKATRIDTNRIYHVADPGGTVEISWHTQDSRYKLVGLSDWE